MISARDAEYWKPHKCPVCGEFEFPQHGSEGICGVCGWQDDPVQEDDPDYGGANWETLNGYRALYKAGMHEASSDEKYEWLKEHGFIKEIPKNDDREYYIIGSDEE